MGVVWVIDYPVPEGKGQQTVDILIRRIEELGAVKTSNFVVDCETYGSNSLPSQRLVHVLHNSEQPASCFAVMDNGECLVADALFDLLMMRMKTFYAPHKNAKVESKGQRYKLGDFIIKIGSVVMGQNTSFRGVLVEVEYTPCVVPKECWELMKEFLQSFLGSSSENITTHLKSRMDLMFEPSDTILQYLEHFNNNFRKSAQLQQQQPPPPQQQQQQIPR